MKRENISDAIDMLDEELLETVAEMRGQKKARRFSASRLVGIVAAAVLVISATLMTVTATYRFEVDQNDIPRLLETAHTYATQNIRLEEDGMKQIHFIDYCWDDYRYDESVEGKLTGLRPVYNVKFKVAGSAYDVDIDIKTEVVTRFDRTVDTEWDAHFDDYENFERLHTNWMIMVGDLEPDVEVGKMNVAMADDVFKDYFGIDDKCKFSLWRNDDNTFGALDYSTDPMTVQLSYYHGGYVYECRVNSVTAEVTDINIREALYEETIHPYTYKPDDTLKHLHEHSDDSEFIGRYKANIIAIEELGFPKGNSNYWDFSIALHTDREIYNTSTAKYEQMPEGVDAYYLYYVRPGPWIEPDQTKPGVNVFINARTGEVLKVEWSNNYRYSSFRPSYTPSADAPEGMISEADAQVIVMEDLGLEKKLDIMSFSIELVDDKYEVYIAYMSYSFEWEYDYTIDAVSGEILKKTRHGR